MIPAGKGAKFHFHFHAKQRANKRAHVARSMQGRGGAHCIGGHDGQSGPEQLTWDRTAP